MRSITNKTGLMCRPRFNGKAVEQNFLNHQALLQGGELHFDMSAEPNTSRGVTEQSRPYSVSARLLQLLPRTSIQTRTPTNGIYPGSNINPYSRHWSKPLRFSGDDVVVFYLGFCHSAQ